MKKFIDFLVVPHGKEPALNFRLSVSVTKVIIILLSIWILLFITATVFYGKLSYRALRAEQIEHENERLRDYNAKVVQIEKSFRKNQELVARIASLAGVELDDLTSSMLEFDDSLTVDGFSQKILTGFAGDRVPLSTEELEQMRTPKGRPLYGWVTRGFIEGDSKDKHMGVDIAVKEGTPVVVSATGIVEFAGWDNDFGNLIIVNHENSFKTVYGHNKKIIASKGEKVFKGDVIALSGNSGHSSAPHLHYEILKDNKTIDPSQYLD